MFRVWPLWHLHKFVPICIIEILFCNFDLYEISCRYYYLSCRITIPVVISRLKLLFSEHQELIEGFNQFLPEEFKITLPLTRRSDTNWKKTISFVNKVKVNFTTNKDLGSFKTPKFSHSSLMWWLQLAFSQERERYASFLQLITGYQEAGMNLQGLSEQVFVAIYHTLYFLYVYQKYIKYKLKNFKITIKSDKEHEEFGTS